jgi:hypothetical protein
MMMVLQMLRAANFPRIWPTFTRHPGLQRFSVSAFCFYLDNASPAWGDRRQQASSKEIRLTGIRTNSQPTHLNDPFPLCGDIDMKYHRKGCDVPASDGFKYYVTGELNGSTFGPLELDS